MCLPARCRSIFAPTSVSLPSFLRRLRPSASVAILRNRPADPSAAPPAPGSGSGSCRYATCATLAAGRAAAARRRSVIVNGLAISGHCTVTRPSQGSWLCFTWASIDAVIGVRKSSVFASRQLAAQRTLRDRIADALRRGSRGHGRPTACRGRTGGADSSRTTDAANSARVPIPAIRPFDRVLLRRRPTPPASRPAARRWSSRTAATMPTWCWRTPASETSARAAYRSAAEPAGSLGFNRRVFVGWHARLDRSSCSSPASWLLRCRAASAADLAAAQA